MKNNIVSQVIRLSAVILLIIYGLSAHADENKSELIIDDQVVAEIEYNIQSYKMSIASLAAQNEYNASRIMHQKELMKIAEEAYATQQVTTVLIFVVVLILVLGGLWLSYLQFKADMSKQNLSEDGTPKASFKIGKEGIEFSSSVIGLIVLFMSFSFFHLYVKDVYTIKTHEVATLTIDSESTGNSQ